ncbi:MAG TPA: HEAT repeat domain-containing protein [Candidatus Ozemobacteraceae bacterium]|nr:HEAT repeat domain-containing protein [Candidatus Ozemobacteraceae bacterium]
MTTPYAAILEKLHDTDPSVRRRAVRDLRPYPEKEVAEALCEALGDANKGVQNTAMDVLSSMRHPSVIQALLPVIRGSDLNTRNAGMTILKNFGPMAVPHLIKAIEAASDIDEVIQILVVFGNIGSPAGTDTVLGYVAHDDDNVKTTAVEALGKIQDPKAVKTLVNTYHQTDILKYSIVEALGNIAVKDVFPVVSGSIESEDVLEYFSGIGAMGAMEDPDCVEPLMKKLLKEEDAGTRRLILKSLSQIEDANPGSAAKIDKKALQPILLNLLEGHDTAEYGHLVRIAAAVKDPAYIKELLAALESPEADIADIAFRGLLALGKDVVRPALDAIGRMAPPVIVRIMELLEKIPSPDAPKALSLFCRNPEDAVRQALARTLGAVPSDAAFTALKELLGDADEVVRRNAVVSLRSMLTYDGAISALIGCFKDINGHVRREAAFSLRGAASPQVVEPLMNLLLTDPYGDVREAAASVLAARKDPEITRKLLELLDSDNSRIRETITKTIWQCGSALAVDSLIHKLADKEWRVVVNACQSLENMKDLKSIFPLKELLKHDDWQIRIAALSALRAFRSKELKQFFIPLIGDSNSNVAKLAVVALSELEDRSLDDTFRKYLDHTRWEVRYQIVKALGKIKSQKAVDTLIRIAESDANNGVRSKALLALARISDKKAINAALALLEHADRDLNVAAVKFFIGFDNPQVPDLEAKLKALFLGNPWIKQYFLAAFGLNKHPMLESVLRAVATPRELRRMEKAAAVKAEGNGMTIEEAILLRDIVAEKCGIWLPEQKSLERALERNLGKFYITSWMEYYHALRYGADDQNLFISLYDTITDPRTGFFAEPEQNKVLVGTIIPELIEERVKAGVKTLRILSIGCSYGPEPYSLAMNILEDIHTDRVKISVAGVDISHICLNTAKRGIFKREIMRHVDQKYIDVYFEDDRGDLRVKDDVKNLVEFKYVNAASTAETEDMGPYDVIVCRNVFSAFSQEQKERLSENIYNILAPGGALLIGARETLYNVTKAFRLQTYEKVVVYRKL